MTGNLFQESASGAEWFTAHCDGGSRGNPGPSGYGAVVEGPDGIAAAHLSEFLGIQTNNYAEYSGLVAVLRWAVENGARRLRVVSDSELMVKQMKGQYKVSSPALRPLWEEARQLSRRLEGFEIRHTLRAGNKDADRLANEAMDKGMGRASAPAESRPYGRIESSMPTRGQQPAQAGRPATRQARPRLELEGFVKDGVVHLLNGTLPDGVFVKVVRE